MKRPVAVNPERSTNMMKDLNRQQKQLVAYALTTHVMAAVLLLFFLLYLNVVHVNYQDLQLGSDAAFPLFRASRAVSEVLIAWPIPAIILTVILALVDVKVICFLVGSRRDVASAAWTFAVTAVILIATGVSAWTASKPARSWIRLNTDNNGFIEKHVQEFKRFQEFEQRKKQEVEQKDGGPDGPNP
jgi:hypothetical protein